MFFFLAVVYAALTCSFAAPSYYGYAPAADQSAYAPATSYGGSNLRAPTMDEMKEMPTTQPPPRDYQFSYNINDEMSGSLNQRVEQQKNGVITGAYAYTAPDGKLMTVNYVADDKGYRPVMSEAQAPVMKTNTASTYTMSLPDSVEQIKVSITQQEMEAMRNKVQENEQPLAYAQNQQNVPMKYTASTYTAAAVPAMREQVRTYPTPQQSAIHTPHKYDASAYAAPAPAKNEPVETYPAIQENFPQVSESPEQYSAPVKVNIDPAQTYRAPSPVTTIAETPIQAESRPASYYR
ncbi:uncharacterized protein LOC136041390 [Artemia franciscana]|uniref:Cuticle protein n=1 Tax=Artemia franciscana TaxID=6661 RepID=A0AA88H3N4_ARTSF|nr:hypothetical protein QYM36_017723 [Artemia franciscana]